MPESKLLISFVLPMHNEEGNVREIVIEIKKYIPENLRYEFVLVNDGSSDNTKDEIKKLAKKDPHIKGISFYRNFGHQAALLAGISTAKGDLIMTMDSDFQHPPSMIPEMYEKWKEGHDLVLARKKNDPTYNPIIKIFRKIGYSFYKFLGDDKIIPGVSDFRLMDKVVADYILSCNEVNYIMRGIIMIPSRKYAVVPYEVAKRKSGKSSYTFGKLLNLFIYSLTSFSLKPIRTVSLFGIFLIFLSVLYLVVILYLKLIMNVQIIQGWTALVFIILLLFGFNFIYLGILSEYVGIIFYEVKKRPRYLIEEKYNC